MIPGVNQGYKVEGGRRTRVAKQGNGGISPMSFKADTGFTGPYILILSEPQIGAVWLIGEDSCLGDK